MPPICTAGPMALATGDELLCPICGKSVEAEAFKFSDCAKNGVAIVDGNGYLVRIAWAHALCIANPLYRRGPRFAHPKCLRCGERITGRAEDTHRFGQESDGVPVVFCADGWQGWLESWPQLIGPMQAPRAAETADCGVTATA